VFQAPFTNDNIEQGETAMSGLRETFLNELKDLYDAEAQLLKALPKMAEAAEDSDLKAAFQTHQQETEAQILRLERVFRAFGESPAAKKCKGMQGLILEAEELMEEEEGDAALICAAQKAEHYEIAAYGSLSAWAELLEEEEAAELLRETLDEERATDEKLTEIAETVVNVEESAEEAEEEPAPKGRSE
jgi:ferritin-like metal-binding protein YciE